MAWWCTGLRWRTAEDVAGQPVLTWYDGSRGERESVLLPGSTVAFRAVGVRRCLGVWRAGRWTHCPEAAELPPVVTRDQCPSCASLDRARSVASDTMADDPRPYSVYLAWFGPGKVKVGLTRADRGTARLLEQGAVAFCRLGTGPLMAARRTEETLRAALGVPDRIPYAAKRAVRAALPGVEERAAELAAVHAAALVRPELPEALTPSPCQVVDHGAAFGIEGLRMPAGVITGLADGAVVVGELSAAAGPDLHLVTRRGRTEGRATDLSTDRIAGRIADRAVGRPGSRSAGRDLVLDTRLLSGWQLVAVGGEERTTADVRALAGMQGGLF